MAFGDFGRDDVGLAGEIGPGSPGLAGPGSEFGFSDLGDYGYGEFGGYPDFGGFRDPETERAVAAALSYSDFPDIALEQATYSAPGPYGVEPTGETYPELSYPAAPATPTPTASSWPQRAVSALRTGYQIAQPFAGFPAGPVPAMSLGLLGMALAPTEEQQNLAGFRMTAAPMLEPGLSLGMLGMRGLKGLSDITGLTEFAREHEGSLNPGGFKTGQEPEGFPGGGGIDEGLTPESLPFNPDAQTRTALAEQLGIPLDIVMAATPDQIMLWIQYWQQVIQGQGRPSRPSPFETPLRG